jgi:electron-transferring-flavoprotein dehydrogenase
VIDPDRSRPLIPTWRDEDTPIKTEVSDDRFYWLRPRAPVRLPNFMLPPLMSITATTWSRSGNVLPLARTKAEGSWASKSFPALPPPMCCSTQRRGRRSCHRRHGGRPGRHHKDSFTRGMELRAKYTLFAEGARGNLSKTLLQRFGLAEGREPQKFGLGLKELWQVAPEKHRPGLVQHTFGWPLDSRTGGGSFLYHSTTISFGRLRGASQLRKSVPLAVRGVPALQDASAGARHLRGRQAARLWRARLTEGGWQSVPKLAFPGGRLWAARPDS